MSEMTLSEELAWRGMVKDRTFDDAAWLNIPRTFYLGSDCSSDSLTIGNLAIYVLARRLADNGWKPVLLMGGATSLIGDPGGKEEESELKSHEEIEKNVAGIKAQVERLFAGHEFETVNNYDWFKDIGYLEFLRDVGKHFSMTELMQRDFITARMGEGGAGISYAEFSYSLIQGYDYWWLYKNKGVELQIGGSDQWGNMLSGVPLIRKKEGKEVHALSMPLVINKATGKKFGKSEAGAVWLDPAKTSLQDFYQFWVRAEDEDVEEYLKRYTLLSRTEIEGIVAAHAENPKARAGQIRLADEVTTLVHGADAAKEAKALVAALVSDTPSSSQEAKLEVHADASIPDTLVAAGLANSKREARQFLADGGVYINDEQTTKEAFEQSDFKDGLLKLRRGKALQNTIIVRML